MQKPDESMDYINWPPGLKWAYEMGSGFYNWYYYSNNSNFHHTNFVQVKAENIYTFSVYEGPQKYSLLNLATEGTDQI